ncbi:hypothetical protein Clacol_004093 [Clathrus columnatus]|uniref:F-box domain-containing protein n=1 Tax=Clathrus columnatus TaxID=1419009 RepID=A0AAV5A5H7_9AGAM|nr:hypothetical protein Clacol_004093 [Clathrus columnatus]
MVNLRRSKFRSSTTNPKVPRVILGALVDSECRLEEFDLSLMIPSFRQVTREPEKLEIWSKLNLTVLQKLCIYICVEAPQDSLRPLSLLNLIGSIGNMLSIAPTLTHLSLTVGHTSAPVPSPYDFICPNLESVIIKDIGRHTSAPQDQSTLINFFERHPKLTALSLPSHAYLPTSSPYITVERLPRLESLSYNSPVYVPLSQVLSPASAKRLRHLTITEKDASLENSDLGIYRELTSLQTFSFTSETSFYASYHNINRILTNFVTHVTSVEKVHLPYDGRDLGGVYLETLYILQRLPKLTHLSGLLLWMGNLSQDPLLQELQRFSRLEYVIHPSLTPARSGHFDSLKRTGTPQDPSILINFFKRHPKLIALSLPSYVYVPTSSPCITVESLPRLESLSYNPPVYVPLSQVLSPASARRLRHLTISEQDASLEHSNIAIYKELTSLQTCCFTSDTRFPTDFKNVNRILESFVAHVTSVQKIHLPTNGTLQSLSDFGTLSILQCLPNLTHLSGLWFWTSDLSQDPLFPSRQDPLLQEFNHFFRLEYVIHPSLTSARNGNLPVFRLTRDNKTRRISVEDVSLKGRNLDCDMATWGNFYRGMKI